MFRCVRLWTDREGNSQFEEGFIDLPKGERGDILSSVFRVNSISFRDRPWRRVRMAFGSNPAIGLDVERST